MDDQKGSAADQPDASRSSASDNDAGRPKANRKEYDKELRKLQTELCSLQDWVKATGERIIVIFEGRDAAGKGGTIRAMTERVSPRTFRLVALPAPSDREKSQMYVQRYLAHFPAAGEIVIYDRSWYNRAGVEHVMGFCTEKQHEEFLEICPKFEKHIVDSGIRLIIMRWGEPARFGPGNYERRFAYAWNGGERLTIRCGFFAGAIVWFGHRSFQPRL